MKLEDYIRFNKLYDLYGRLLTERQYDVVGMHICDDLSLFEISEKMKITRQAVSDTLTNARIKLEYYEQILGILEKTDATEKLLAEIHNTELSSETEILINKLEDIWIPDYKED